MLVKKGSDWLETYVLDNMFAHDEYPLLHSHVQLWAIEQPVVCKYEAGP